MAPCASKIKKVLIIARVFPPFQSVGHSIRVVKFIKYLPALGWLPVVLTVNDQEEYESQRKVGSEALLNEIQSEVKIFRTTAGEPSLQFLEKEKEFGQRNLLTRVMVKVLGGARRWAFRNIFLPDRYLAWLPFAVRRGRQIVNSEGIDVIFATCPPHSVGLVGAFLKRLTGKPLILDFRDDWVGTPGYHSRPAIRRLIERRLESGVVKSADKVILVTEWSRSAFLARYPKEPSDKFVFIPNGCDLGEFAELNSTASAPRNSRFTIVHAGSMNDSGPWRRNTAALFQAIRLILQKQPELAEKLALVFAGDFQEGHRKLVWDMGLSGLIKELGHLPHGEILRLTKSADLLLAMNYEGFSTMIPGKIYEYWAIAGPPILLLCCTGAAQQFIEQKKLGFAVAHDDVSAIERAILMVYRRREMGFPMKIDTVGIEEYDRKVLSKRLAQILSSVVTQGI